MSYARTFRFHNWLRLRGTPLASTLQEMRNNLALYLPPPERFRVERCWRCDVPEIFVPTHSTRGLPRTTQQKPECFVALPVAAGRLREGTNTRKRCYNGL